MYFFSSASISLQKKVSFIKSANFVYLEVMKRLVQLISKKMDNFLIKLGSIQL